MKNFLLSFLTGLIVVLVLLELIFMVLPVSTATRSGYFIHPLILTYPAHHCFTAATGWDLKNAQHNCSNNFGFLVNKDFVYNPNAVALIGDSFVEANMLPANERLDVQLEAQLGGRPVYGLGGPGSNLLDYAERAKFAADKFGSRTFVFILARSDMKEGICGSGNTHGPCIDLQSLLLKTETQPAPDIFKQVIRESALAQYIFSQLRFDSSRVFAQFSRQKPNHQGSAQKNTETTAAQKVVTQFFSQISTIKNGEFIFLIDADRPGLSDGLTKDYPGLESFLAQAHALNATVIDPTPFFREFVSRSGRGLAVGPYDKHWNKSAIKIIAEGIGAKLR